MKNILKYILSFAFCVGVIFATTTTVNAEESTSDSVICDSAFEVGDSAYLYVELMTNVYDWKYTFILDKEITSEEESRICIYVDSDNRLQMHNAPNGIRYGQQVGTDNTSEMEYWFGNRGWVPLGYANTEDFYTEMYGFVTNIPFFSSYEDALIYINGDDDAVKSALNYKKTFENGSWVRPFEDIEINDSDILVPDLSNISHEGFTVTNCNNELYVCEIYMESGIEKPENYMNGSLNVDNALFVNSFGLITDNSEAYWNGPTFNIAQLYGVDNYSALMNSVNNFYSSYPSPNSYYSGYKASDNYQIWGRPFNKQGIFFMNSTSVNSNDLIGITPYDIPICYTQYRVRYFYYDDDSGYHYGPWGIYTYFSDGSVSKSGLFQSNTGDIIEIPTTSGIQNESGNVEFNTSNIVDLNNPNELFGYLRSTINNINATGNTFMTLFATLFSFIPIELQIALWLGIACMIFIGVIKSI